MCNAVGEVPGGLLLAGFRQDASGLAHRTLWKLSLSGALLWTTSTSDGFGDTTNRHGAWEMIDVTSDAILLAGFHQLDAPASVINDEGLAFKSYGNVFGGEALVTKLPLSLVASTAAAPTAADIAAAVASSTAWTSTFAPLSTAKSARATPANAAVGVLMIRQDEASTSLCWVAQLSYATGAIQWGPSDLDSTHGEGTSLSVDPAGALVVGGWNGHVAGRYAGTSDLLASMTKISPTGDLLWSRGWSVLGATKTEWESHGYPEFLRHECWGVQATASGYGLFCGVGIEGCSEAPFPASVRASCDSGVADTRPGAHPRSESIFNVLTIFADADGNRLWQRVDSFREDEPDAPANPPRGGSSAGEWGIPTAEGGFVVVADDDSAGGLGLLKLRPAAAPPPPPACSTACANEFAGCTRFVVQGAPQGYQSCRNQLNSGTHPRLNSVAGCIPFCADTPSMAALRAPPSASAPPPPPPPPSSGQPVVSPPPAPTGGSGALLSGTYSLGGRGFEVLVPSGASASYPVLLLLHGNGANGRGTLQGWSGNSGLASARASHILVAPDGPERSWNIVAEASTFDDVGYIGSTLIDHLATFSNVQPSFRLYGASNGAALSNRILIENDDARITAAVTDGSQLNTHQFNDDQFYVGGATNSYTTPKTSLTRRALLQIVGGQDGVIPADGGRSVIPDGAGGVLEFVEWEASLFVYARAYGYTGGVVDLAQNDATLARATYLGGQVQGYNYHQLGHVVAMGDVGVGSVVSAFLAEHGGGDPSGLSPPPPPPPPPPPSGSPPADVSCPTPPSTCALIDGQRTAHCSCQYVWSTGCSSPTSTRLTCVA